MKKGLLDRTFCAYRARARPSGGVGAVSACIVLWRCRPFHDRWPQALEALIGLSRNGAAAAHAAVGLIVKTLVDVRPCAVLLV